MDESGVSSGDEMINLQDSHDLFASDTDDPMGAELSDSNKDDNNASAVSGGVDTSAVSGASMDVDKEVLPINPKKDGTAASSGTTEQPKGDTKHKSDVWTSFTREGLGVKKGSSVARCKLCKDTVIYYGNTSSLWRHLGRNHKKGHYGPQTLTARTGSLMDHGFTGGPKISAAKKKALD